MRHGGSGARGTWQTYGYSRPILSISKIRMSGQSGRDGTSSSVLPPDSGEAKFTAIHVALRHLLNIHKGMG